MHARNILSLGLIFCMVPVASSSGDEKTSWREVSFPSPDGGTVSADLYGSGEHGVVLAHGRVFDKESWRPLALRLAKEGLMVLAIDFRGYGASKPGKEEGALYNDVLAAITYLRGLDVHEVSVIGASMGGGAAARAAVESKAGDIDRLVLLSPVPIKRPEDIRAGSVLYIASKDERLFATVESQYKRAPEPKRLEVLEGDAHAQNIFKTEHGPDLTEFIVQFLIADEKR